jgi:hypothetical protein
MDNRGSILDMKQRRDFSLRHRVQTGSAVHPATYPMGIWDSYPGGKAAGAWSWPVSSI